MRSLSERLPVLAAALWWCSLTVVGFLVVPLLFRHLPTPALAGGMAAHLFTAQTWVSIGCAVLLLGLSRSGVTLAPAVDAAVMFVILGLLLALVVEFGIAPRIVGRQNLALWHGVGTGLYLAQWLCAAAVLWRLLRPPAPR
jgi:hypothetical protein